MNYLEMDTQQIIDTLLERDREIQALRKDAERYRWLKNVCVTSTDFTGTMQSDDSERWCVLRRTDGIISSFSCDDLDHAINAAMEQQT